jgi:NhaA family Na+:H+ antiporter
MFPNVIQLFSRICKNEKAGGAVLIVCTAVSLILANSSVRFEYLYLWQLQLGGMSVEHWINDVLMAVFFLFIGLELEREIYAGELSSVKKAMFPVVAALGGMCVPAAIYAWFNYGTASQPGTGIPTATDIAFALGVLSLLGNRVPPALKIFLIALAVADDLGAIIIISLFYTKTLMLTNLLAGFAIFGALLILNRCKVYSPIPYILGGAAMWYFIHHSGVHATITGVLLAFAVPFGRKRRWFSPSYMLQKSLRHVITFVILPLFALANTAIPVESKWSEIIMQPSGLGISLGLLVGKPLGITVFSLIAVLLGVCRLPRTVNWLHIVGTGILGGIGFTMSIFITMLAFDDITMINNAKLSILLSSCIAAIVGLTVLHFTLKQHYIRQVYGA